VPHAGTRRPPRRAQSRLALAVVLTTTIVISAALTTQPALADHCGGTLVPTGGNAAGDTATYTLNCDVPVEGLYTVTAVAANGEPIDGTVHDASQGFACVADTAPEAEEPEGAEAPEGEGVQASEPVPSTWDCAEGSADAGEPIEGLFTTEQSPCAASLTLRITIYEQVGSAMSPVTQTTLAISCPNGGSGGSYGSGGREGGGSGGATSHATRPTVSAVRVYPPTFKAAERGGGGGASIGARVSYKLSASARTTFTLERILRGVKHGRRCLATTGARHGQGSCTRDVKVAGDLAQYGSAGPNTLHFTGVLAGRKLAPGAYLFVVTARIGSGPAGSAVHSPQFHVVS